jgi:hypothetical protein
MMETCDGAHMAKHILRMLAIFRRSWDDLSDEQLNQEPPFAPSNTIYQNAVHVAGSTRFWTITDTGGEDFHRDRDAEFIAIGPGDPVRQDYDVMVGQIETHMATLTAADLDRPQAVPDARFGGWSRPITYRDAILHAQEHIGIHVGHVQIQRQLLGLDPVK